MADEEGWERERQTAPTASLPVSEIKRRGRNLAEGCKYYKVTLRRMRELKGTPERVRQREEVEEEREEPRRTMRTSEQT